MDDPSDPPWTFVAAVWTGCRWGPYVDGKVVGDRLVLGGALPEWTGEDFTIGNSLATAYDGFVGVIDEVRIHDKALTAAEINWQMQQ